MAKKFFYVCAGVFLLAISYHLGASNATAQAPSDPIVAAASGYFFAESGDVYMMSGEGPLQFGNLFALAGHAPSPVTCAQLVGASLQVATSTGDVLRMDTPGVWYFAGSLGPSGTSAGRSSWGALKDRYR